MTMVLIASGVPGVGKTTVMKEHFAESGAIVLSSDEFIELVATASGKTYDQVFDQVVDQANSFFWAMYEFNLKAGTDRIILDRTFLTPKSRRRALELAKRYNAEIAIVSCALPKTDVEHNEWNRRLERPGKTIPKNVLIDMYCSFVPPSEDEGFSHIEYINTFED